MNNTELQTFYNDVYEKGEENYYSKFRAGNNISENDDVVFEVTDFLGKTVLDVGCGTGELARRIGKSGAKMVYGIDYAASAIEVAKSKNSLSNVDFKNISLSDWEGLVDVVISCGTLEHMDQPWDVLQQFANLVKPEGEVIISCPHFFNLRGFLWVGLQKLFDVPMSLTDVHSIAPFDIQKWIENTSLELVTIKTFDSERANGDLAIVDMKKRLTNALRDADMSNDNVDNYLEWMNDVVEYMKGGTSTLQMEGGNALYYMKKENKN
jgi:2-polyprenyl-3-methyl-5-hydroxy-6-metoxy-1,4-benzoquinol methylase